MVVVEAMEDCLSQLSWGTPLPRADLASGVTIVIFPLDTIGVHCKYADSGTLFLTGGA
jgi:hypothetical protein